MKAFSFPSSLFSSVEASHASSRLPSLIFSLLFLPSCPHSIHFHFPLSSLYSCFHFNPISQSSPTPILHPSQSFHQLSDKLRLTPSTCLSSPFSFNLPFFIFPQTAPSSQTFSSFIGIFCLLLPLFFLDVHSASTLSNAPTLLPFLAKPSTDQLSSPA